MGIAVGVVPMGVLHWRLDNTSQSLSLVSLRRELFAGHLNNQKNF